MGCVMGSPTPDKELGKADILESDDVRIDKVRVPEWGGYVYVRSLSGVERDRFEESQSQVDKKGNRTFRVENFRARLCALCICNAKGELLFVPADIHRLALKSAAALSRVFDRATEISGFTKEDIEDLVGNSEDDPSDDSG